MFRFFPWWWLLPPGHVDVLWLLMSHDLISWVCCTRTTTCRIPAFQDWLGHPWCKECLIQKWDVMALLWSTQTQGRLLTWQLQGAQIRKDHCCRGLLFKWPNLRMLMWKGAQRRMESMVCGSSQCCKGDYTRTSTTWDTCFHLHCIKSLFSERCQKHFLWAKRKMDWAIASKIYISFRNQKFEGRVEIQASSDPVWNFHRHWCLSSAGVCPLRTIKCKVNTARKLRALHASLC